MQFVCPNCRLISEIDEIEIDEVKRNKSKDIQKEIDDLESEIKKEEDRGWLAKEGLISCLRFDVLKKIILKNEYETEYKYIDCPICQKRHYIKSIE